ncbi:MAG: 4'-phosphopantetheinyl transferase superfamily protein [Ectothiorhodospiraceae bacterium]|nr:4'-phosphopantetheinyl transferase superfamily protein [Ectothiorhodospiraceae bacterium]
MPHELINIQDTGMGVAPELVPLKIHHPSSTVRSFLAILTESIYAGIEREPQNWFHPSEWSRVNALKVEKRRKEFVLGRCACKLATSAYLEEPHLEHLVINAGIFGQPILRFLSNHHPELSITHTDTVALAVASEQGCPIGLDIEKLTDRNTDFLAEHITQRDLRLLAGLTPNVNHAYFRAWTIKEALSKVLRCGITIPFALLELEPPTLIDANSFYCEYRNFPQYRCYSWSLGQYLIAIVAPRNVSLEVDADILFSRLVP